ncbi:MAG TPA: helix-turn-helix transcriptional regulator [Blastocatellia bacterium]
MTVTKGGLNPRTHQLTVRELEALIFGRTRSELADAVALDSRIERAWRLIEEGYGDPKLSARTVARSVGLSEYHLRLLMRESTGLTVRELITRHKLMKAALLMQMRDRKMLAVAMDAGFGSAGAFTRNFAEVLGMTPGAFRKEWTVLGQGQIPGYEPTFSK